MKFKSVKSKNPCQTLPTLKLRQASVIQTSYDIVKAHQGELSFETSDLGTTFKITLPIKS